MAGLKATAAAFFTFWFITFLATFVMTAFFRMCGAAFPNFDAASKVSGFAVSALVTFVGYEQPKPEMHPWFVWIYWIDPLSYAFESLLSNEFKGQTIPCVNNNLIPNFLPQYTGQPQACSGVGGARPYATSVSGEEYLASLSYSPSHIWRNVGILFAWWALFVGLTIGFTLRWQDASEAGKNLVIPREKMSKHFSKQAQDEESQTTGKESSISSRGLETENPDLPAGTQLVRNTSVFTWRNLTYTVKTPTGDRVLLDNVNGYVKPGMLGALMGSSGTLITLLLCLLRCY